MKVWFVIETETFKDDDRRKKYYEYLETGWAIMQNKHEGVKHKYLGSWSDNPGWVMHVHEYENMEEFSKIWSDEELQKEWVKWRNHCKTFRVRIMRPTVSVR